MVQNGMSHLYNVGHGNAKPKNVKIILSKMNHARMQRFSTNKPPAHVQTPCFSKKQPPARVQTLCFSKKQPPARVQTLCFLEKQPPARGMVQNGKELAVLPPITRTSSPLRSNCKEHFAKNEPCQSSSSVKTSNGGKQT